MKKQITFFLLMIVCKVPAFAQIPISPSEINNHIGEPVSIHGTIYGGHSFESFTDQPTVLYLSDSFPGIPVLIIIPAAFKINFHPDLIQYYLNKNVTIHGIVQIVRSVTEIILTDSSQLLVHLSNLPPPAIDSSQSLDISSPMNLDTYNNCPLTGESTNQRLQNLNKSKNRYNMPGANSFNANASISSLLKPGNDKTRWKISDAVELTGYVYDVKPGGVETCNCHSTNKSFMDTHIVLLSNPGNNKGSQRIIVEITPRLRFLMMQHGIDWSTDKIKATYMGHWIKVKGWLFFDEEHTSSAENTNPGNASNWRATAWEVHPIISIELINHP